MAADLIADLEVHDPAAFDESRRRVAPLIERFGGRYHVRGGAVDVLEGDWRPPRLVVVEFADMAALRRFYEADEYRDLLEPRRRSARSHFTAVEGV
jgi:uncharacterized protein (DUF1330 family)